MVEKNIFQCLMNRDYDEVDGQLQKEWQHVKFTPLSIATGNAESIIKAGQSGDLEILISQEPALINVADDYDSTLLHKAAVAGSENCLRVLIKHGSAVNKADAGGHNPLWHAAMKNRLESVRILLAAGADQISVALKSIEHRDDVSEVRDALNSALKGNVPTRKEVRLYEPPFLKDRGETERGK